MIALLHKLIIKRSQARRKAVFIRALIPYFWDVVNNGGKKSQYLYNELLDKTKFYQQTNRWDDWTGNKQALEIIQQYREWEGKSWSGR